MSCRKQWIKYLHSRRVWHCRSRVRSSQMIENDNGASSQRHESRNILVPASASPVSSPSGSGSHAHLISLMPLIGYDSLFFASDPFSFFQKIDSTFSSQYILLLWGSPCLPCFMSKMPVSIESMKFLIISSLSTVSPVCPSSTVVGGSSFCEAPPSIAFEVRSSGGSQPPNETPAPSPSSAEVDPEEVDEEKRVNILQLFRNLRSHGPRISC
mmetsp:Transcript_19417/g.40632  ORF Transcript_19417/g.40632 Transcript_19417/m.40632 type:complete len:212 (+) Transcript_19417:292-927(+)